MGLISRLLSREKPKNSDGSWGGLDVGDVVQYKNRQFLYRGINPNGGPSMPGLPEPTFGMPRPSVTRDFYITYYLRNDQNQPGGIPRVMFESEPPIKAGHLNYISFLNATRSDLAKIGHISEKVWKSMIQELQTRLSKSAGRASKVIAGTLNDRGYSVQTNHLVSNPLSLE